MNEKIIRTYKTGTKLVEGDCPRCEGTGIWDAQLGRDDGRCFRCNGSGVSRWLIYTEEHKRELEAKKIANIKKNAPEENLKMFKRNGLDESGNAWVVLGNTFEIKETLKEAGARFDRTYGWHFDHEVDDFETVKVEIDRVCNQNEFGEYCWIDDEKVKAIKKEAEKDHEIEKPVSEYVGNLKDKLTIEVRLVNIYSYETNYTYYGGVGHIYTMKDNDGNVFVWKTSSYLEVPFEGNEERWENNENQIKKGEVFTLKGTVKDHSEYRGVKQTVLTRCKVL